MFFLEVRLTNCERAAAAANTERKKKKFYADLTQTFLSLDIFFSKIGKKYLFV